MGLTLDNILKLFKMFAVTKKIKNTHNKRRVFNSFTLKKNNQ